MTRNFGQRLMGILGVSRCKDRRLGFRFRLRFFCFAGLAVLLGFGGWSFNYSTSPEFCRSCHLMEPYHEAWARSAHKDVACVECHYPPDDSTSEHLWRKFQAFSQVAKFVTQTYSSRPYAEVSDASCLQSDCHAKSLLAGKIKTDGGIKFDHGPHLDTMASGRQLRCVSCHSQLEVGNHMEVTYDTCFLCHFKGHKNGRTLDPVGGCTACHDLPSREVVVANITYNHQDFMKNGAVACEKCHQDVVHGDGVVETNRCLSCHNETQKVSWNGNSLAIHDAHVTEHNTHCFRCHGNIRHRAAPAGTKTLTYECSACHSQAHDVQRELYKGLGARGVEPMPSPMYLANVDCVACHIQKDASDPELHLTQTWTGTEQGCVDCHGPEYKGTLAGTHELTDDAVTALVAKLEAIRKALDGTPAAAQEASVLDDVGHNLKYMARAHAVHNVYYASQILGDADARLTAVAGRHGVEVDDTSELAIVSGAFCATLCHARVGVQVPKETVTWQGKEMPHLAHVEDEGLPCSFCHVFGQHKVVKMKEPSRCSLCHEEDE